MYTEVQTAVEKYFKDELSKGSAINDIVRNLKSGSLPWDLRQLECPISEIRRIGQHVSTQYVVKQAEEHSKITDLNY